MIGSHRRSPPSIISGEESVVVVCISIFTYRAASVSTKTLQTASHSTFVRIVWTWPLIGRWAGCSRRFWFSLFRDLLRIHASIYARDFFTHWALCTFR